MVKIGGVLLAFVIFYSGLGVGFFLRGWLLSRTSYSGVIFVTKEDEEIMYHLWLHEDPEDLPFMNEAVFKIDASVGDK